MENNHNHEPWVEMGMVDTKHQTGSKRNCKYIFIVLET